MADYPLVEKFLADKPFGPNHAAHDLTLCDPIVPALEYFLSINAVSGHSRKLDDIKSKPVGTPCKNDRLIQWASLCAEIGAICLLGKTLGLEIVGLEQVSPQSLRSNANCDVVAVVNGEVKYFEVKRNAAEDKQCLPELLEQRLNQLESELPFGMMPQLLDRDYDCTGLDEKLSRIKDHVAAFQRHKREGRLAGECRPPAFQDEAFEVVFYPIESRGRRLGVLLSCRSRRAIEETAWTRRKGAGREADDPDGAEGGQTGSRLSGVLRTKMGRLDQDCGKGLRGHFLQ